MKNVIMQHFDNDNLRELDRLSVENIKKYATFIGAEYKLIIGYPFRKGFTAPIQKLYMLDAVFDKYETVVMLDIDMFVPKNMKENIFDYPGIGLHGEIQTKLRNKLVKQYPHISDKKYPYWGGAIYKMDLKDRQTLRAGLHGNTEWMQHYNRRYHFGDEGIMHTLAMKSNFIPKNPYLDKKWCRCSFLPNIEKAGLIHIRTKVSPNGPKREKIQNYKELKRKGIIE